MSRKVFVVGTCDTKFAELKLIIDILEALGIDSWLVDVSTKPHLHHADVSSSEVRSYATHVLTKNEALDRGMSITHMSGALERFFLSRKDFSAVIGLGGSGGTALISRAMRALPIGIPKVLVSTVASGNVAPYVDVSDLMMINAVTDIAGINPISHRILSNAAHAVVGMVQHQAADFRGDKPLVGITMFGVTTPCVTQLKAALAGAFEAVVFHATGTGGRAMEKMISSDLIPYVIDVTTTEIADLLMGGTMSAGPSRMDIIIEKRMPYCLSVGALDMVNFGAIHTVPQEYKDRLLYKHNDQVTLMRTTPEENVKMAEWIADKVNRSTAPVSLFLPLRGVSALSVEGQPFHDPEADSALFETLQKNVKQSQERKVLALDCDINDARFSDAIAAEFLKLVDQ